MSEKFTRVFSLGENLYQQGSPIVLEAGDIVKENSTGKVWARLKLRNIADCEIRAIQVRLLPCDVKGAPLPPVTHQYLDLDAGGNCVFGQSEIISLPDDCARSFSVDELEVTFFDNTAWHSSGEWASVFTKKLLTDQLSNELAEQYRRLVGRSAKYIPENDLELWLCTCGTINSQEAQACLTCDCKKYKVFEALQVDTLQSHLEAAQKAKAKRNTWMMITAGIMAVLVILGIAFAPQIRLALVWHELINHTYFDYTTARDPYYILQRLKFYTEDKQKIVHYEQDCWTKYSLPSSFDLEYYVKSIERDTDADYLRYIVTCTRVNKFGNSDEIELWITKDDETGYLKITAYDLGGFFKVYYERED